MKKKIETLSQLTAAAEQHLRVPASSRTQCPELVDVELIFRQDGPPSAGNHYGCRIAQDGDGNIFLTMGDHEELRHEVQSLANHIGKIVRIRPNGTVPPDNRAR